MEPTNKEVVAAVDEGDEAKTLLGVKPHDGAPDLAVDNQGVRGG